MDKVEVLKMALKSMAYEFTSENQAKCEAKVNEIKANINIDNPVDIWASLTVLADLIDIIETLNESMFESLREAV